MQPERSEARKPTSSAISSGSATRPSGEAAAICSTASGSPIAVRTGPGATVFTRTPRPPNSAAHARVSACSAALLAL